MGTRAVTDEFAQRVTADLRARYELDEDDIRALGAKLASDPAARRDKNLQFAERFVADHRQTFDRLGR